jgi:uncharacterized protein (TIGR02246 family)
MNHDDQIARVLRAFEAGWAAADGEAVSRLFRDDAVFTTPTFERSIGRAAIARSEQQAYDTYFAGTRVAFVVERSALLRDDLALLHTTNRIFRGDTAIVESHAMAVLDGAGGEWRIAGWHNLVPLQAPPH